MEATFRRREGKSTIQRVVVGLSGGVDSSVSAYLLLKQGYEVIGLFMKNWHDDTVVLNSGCPWIEDSNDALIVAQTLGIPFQTIDLSVEYKKRIVDYMFTEYSVGRTPNPDVLCNREIKFDIFLKTALQLGAHYVATGHYCQKRTFTNRGGTAVHRLIAGADKRKDQSYFLCQLTQESLSYALFPIGHLQKSEVRKIAATQGLITAHKKDSQGLCFVGKIKLPHFLQQQLKPQKGKIIEIAPDAATFEEHQKNILAATSDMDILEAKTKPFDYSQEKGKCLGEHNGAHYFTIGQRRGLAVGGTPLPLFVIGIDTQINVIYVGQGKRHSGLYRSGLFIPNEDTHWLRPDLALSVGEEHVFMVKIRYRQALRQATLYQRAEGLYIIFDEAERGITAGQFAAWYQEEELIGSGVIA